MADENDTLDLDLDSLDEVTEPQIENRNKLVERIRKLSTKVGTSEAEKTELAKLNDKLKKANEEISKERDFYASFTDASAKYPGATDFKDAILEKVKGGYTVEDATVAVLAKEGKLGASPAPAPENPAGGSAVNQLEAGGEKSFEDLSREEKREKIKELEAKGEIGFT